MYVCIHLCASICSPISDGRISDLETPPRVAPLADPVGRHRAGGGRDGGRR